MVIPIGKTETPRKENSLSLKNAKRNKWICKTELTEKENMNGVEQTTSKTWDGIPWDAFANESFSVSIRGPANKALQMDAVLATRALRH